MNGRRKAESRTKGLPGFRGYHFLFRGFSGGHGFTILEILLALVILAIGIISILALFPIGMISLRRNISRTRAATISRSARSILEAENAAKEILDHPEATAAGRANLGFTGPWFYPEDATLAGSPFVFTDASIMVGANLIQSDASGYFARSIDFDQFSWEAVIRPFYPSGIFDGSDTVVQSPSTIPPPLRMKYFSRLFYYEDAASSASNFIRDIDRSANLFYVVENPSASSLPLPYQALYARTFGDPATGTEYFTEGQFTPGELVVGQVDPLPQTENILQVFDTGVFGDYLFVLAAGDPFVYEIDRVRGRNIDLTQPIQVANGTFPLVIIARAFQANLGLDSLGRLRRLSNIQYREDIPSTQNNRSPQKGDYVRMWDSGSSTWSSWYRITSEDTVIPPANPAWMDLSADFAGAAQVGAWFEYGTPLDFMDVYFDVQIAVYRNRKIISGGSATFLDPADPPDIVKAAIFPGTLREGDYIRTTYDRVWYRVKAIDRSVTPNTLMLESPFQMSPYMPDLDAVAAGVQQNYEFTDSVVRLFSTTIGSR